MTYIVKTMSDGKHGIYDTVRACFPIASPALRDAGIERIEGTDERGWFKKADKAQAESIALTLNNFHGEGVSQPKSKKKATNRDDDMAAMADALIADQA